MILSDSPVLLLLLDALFFSLHIVVTLFNALGWIWSRTRRVHLAVILVTAFSWFALGAVFGWGYCFLTDWHWQVRYRRGVQEMPDSFITYALDVLFGLQREDLPIDGIVGGWFFFALAASLYLNIRDLRSARRSAA